MMVDNAPFDKTKKGRIVNHINGKYYNVQLGNEIYKAFSPTFTYNENDIVYVKIAENNYNNLIIECPVKQKGGNIIKPILYNIFSFDANKDFVFRFKWDGNQSFGNIVEIKNNQSGNVVYQKTQTTMQLQHSLPARTLINGLAYNVRIASIDVDGNISDYSSPVLFYCYE